MPPRLPRSPIAAALALALAAGAALRAQQPTRERLPEDRDRGAATIAAPEMRGWLTLLASEEFAGRGTGTEGFRLAAELVRDHFRALGLEPAGDDGGYWQVVPWTRSAPDRKTTFVALRRHGEEIFKLTAADGLHGRGTVDVDHEGPAAIAVTEEVDGHDLVELDLTDKCVIVYASVGLLGESSQGASDAARPFYARRNFHQIRRAVLRAGGRLVAVVDDEAHAMFGEMPVSDEPERGSAGPAGAARNRSPEMLVLRRSDLDEILAATGGDLAGEGARVFDPPGVSATSRVEIVRAQAPAYNVVGVLRGSDPKLRDEYVVIGSHLDHLGKRGGVVHPGADDDGSGTVAVMAIAKAFARNPVRPERSVLFVTFAGEERGLIGSSYFVKNPPIPLESIVSELQLDMVGRSANEGREHAEDNRNSVYLIGSDRLSNDLHELCMRLNESRAGFDVKLENVQDVFTRSDHFNFAKHGVPIVFFFTGFHEDYHRPSDTVDKIEFDKLVRVAKYVYDIAFELATSDQRPLVDPGRWRLLRNKARRNPAAPTRDR